MGGKDKAKVGEMDGLLLNLPVSPQNHPLPGKLSARSELCPWPALGAASAQTLQPFRVGEIKYTLIHHYSDKALFSPLLRSYLERDRFAET